MTDHPSSNAPEPINIPVIWVENGQPVQWVNAFLSQFQQDEFVVTLGQVAPPLVNAPTEEERQAQLRSVQFVPANTLLKMSLNRRRLVELIGTLQEILTNHDQTFKTP